MGVKTFTGLDLSATETGMVTVAVDCNGQLTGFVQRTIKGEGKGLRRASQIAADIRQELQEAKPAAIVIENYGFGNAHTLATLVEVGTVVRYFLLQDGWKVGLVPPTVLKKFVTGKGNAAKNHMPLAIYKRWGAELENHNVADAFGLAIMAAAWRGGFPSTKADQGCLTKISLCS